MLETKIEWTDFTVNFWEGCQKVGPGCDNCYAEARDVRFTGGSHWGPGAPRRKVKGGIAKLQKINRDAPKFHAENGHWPRAFCSSLSDVFDNAVDPAWRSEAFDAIEAATDCRVQILTKRVGNVGFFIPDHWRDGRWPSHVGLMITVVNQAEVDRDIPKLLDLKERLGIPWVGLSMEPLLGAVDIRRYLRERLNIHAAGVANDPMAAGMLAVSVSKGEASAPMIPSIDWVIVGGESGLNARPMHPDWVRSIRDQCEAAGTPFMFKQWGAWSPGSDFRHDKKTIFMDRSGRSVNRLSRVQDIPNESSSKDGWSWLRRRGKKAAGRELDGVTHDGLPTSTNQTS